VKTRTGWALRAEFESSTETVSKKPNSSDLKGKSRSTCCGAITRKAEIFREQKNWPKRFSRRQHLPLKAALFLSLGVQTRCELGEQLKSSVSG